MGALGVDGGVDMAVGVGDLGAAVGVDVGGLSVSVCVDDLDVGESGVGELGVGVVAAGVADWGVGEVGASVREFGVGEPGVDAELLRSDMGVKQLGAAAGQPSLDAGVHATVIPPQRDDYVGGVAAHRTDAADWLLAQRDRRFRGAKPVGSRGVSVESSYDA
eukprot:1819582-Pyramimonas_sp.AAC.1